MRRGGVQDPRDIGLKIGKERTERRSLQKLANDPAHVFPVCHNLRIGFSDQMLNLSWKMKEQPKQSVELRVADPPAGLGNEGVLARLLAGAGSAKEGLVLSQDSSCLRRQEGAACPVCDAQQGNDLFDAGASALDADAVVDE